MLDTTPHLQMIDISLWTRVASWQRVAEQVSGVLIKSSQGTYEDPWLRYHFDGAGSVGLPRMLWHFYQPNMEPKVQAERFVAIWKSLDVRPRLNWLDVEDIYYSGVSVQPPDPLTYTRWLDYWIGYVMDATGQEVGIYTRKYFWDKHVLRSRQQMGNYVAPNWATYPLWVANYFRATPLLPVDWRDWTIWQYSGDRDLIDGIITEIDRDVANLTLERLRYYAGEDGPMQEIPMTTHACRVGEVLMRANVREDANTSARVWFVAGPGERVEISEQKTDTRGSLWGKIGLRQWICIRYVNQPGSFLDLVRLM